MNKRIVFCLCLVLLLGMWRHAHAGLSIRQAEAPWLADLVTVTEEVMTLEQGHHCLVLYADPLGAEITGEVRVKTRLQAPTTGVISRDHLVVLSAELFHEAVRDPDSGLFEQPPPEYNLIELSCIRLFDLSELFDMALDFSLPRRLDPADLLQKERLTDLVRQSNEQFTLEQVEECSLIQVNEASEELPKAPAFRVKTRVNAPRHGVISRDYFVALATEVLTEVEEQFAQGFFGPAVNTSTSLQCVQLTALNSTSTVDVELDVAMTPQQLQVEITERVSGVKTQSVAPWTEVFPHSDRPTEEPPSVAGGSSSDTRTPATVVG